MSGHIRHRLRDILEETVGRDLVQILLLKAKLSHEVNSILLVESHSEILNLKRAKLNFVDNILDKVYDGDTLEDAIKAAYENSTDLERPLIFQGRFSRVEKIVCTILGKQGFNELINTQSDRSMTPR